jgi:hypothetical protein
LRVLPFFQAIVFSIKKGNMSPWISNPSPWFVCWQLCFVPFEFPGIVGLLGCHHCLVSTFGSVVFCRIYFLCSMVFSRMDARTKE